MMRLATNNSKLSRHARNAQTVYGFGVFVGASGVIASTTMILKDSGYSDWRFATVIHVLVWAIFALCSFMRYVLTFQSRNLYGIKHNYIAQTPMDSTHLSDVLCWRSFITTPKLQELADELLRDIEMAALQLRTATPSMEEKVVMEKRYNLMYELLEEDKKMRRDLRTSTTTDRSTINKIEIHLKTHKEIA